MHKDESKDRDKIKTENEEKDGSMIWCSEEAIDNTHSNCVCL